jgi:hypothetical protein
VAQLRDARAQTAALGVRLEAERCAAEPLARRVAELETLLLAAAAAAVTTTSV